MTNISQYKKERLRYRAIAFAREIHRNQWYCEEKGLTYKYHLQQVESVLYYFGFDEEQDPNLFATAWLHDTLEDTDTTYEDLEVRFGKVIADNVLALTKPKEGTREERFLATVPLLKQREKALIVKIADRIANTEFSKGQKSSHYKMYQKEYPLFKKSLYDPDNERLEDMWKRLDDCSRG